MCFKACNSFSLSNVNHIFSALRKNSQEEQNERKCQNELSLSCYAAFETLRNFAPLSFWHLLFCFSKYLVAFGAFKSSCVFWLYLVWVLLLFAVFNLIHLFPIIPRSLCVFLLPEFFCSQWTHACGFAFLCEGVLNLHIRISVSGLTDAVAPVQMSFGLILWDLLYLTLHSLCISDTFRSTLSCFF